MQGIPLGEGVGEQTHVFGAILSVGEEGVRKGRRDLRFVA